MKRKDATNGKSLDGVESLHRLVKLNQWIVDLKLLPRRSCSFQMQRHGGGKRGEPFGSWETKWAESWNTQTFGYFFFPLIFFFFFSLSPFRWGVWVAVTWALGAWWLGSRRWMWLRSGSSRHSVPSDISIIYSSATATTEPTTVHRRRYLLGRFISFSVCVCVCVCVFFPFETSTRQQLRNFFFLKLQNQNFKCRLLFFQTQKKIPSARQFLNWIWVVFCLVLCVLKFWPAKNQKNEIKRREFRIRRERRRKTCVNRNKTRKD